MTKVLITQSKLDTLAEVIGGKSNTNVPLTVDEMITAADSITSGGGGITPSGNIDITSAGVTDVTNYATATVPQASITMTTNSGFYTENGVRKWRYRGLASCYSGDGDTPGFIDDETAIYSPYTTRNAIASGTTVTPSTSSQTIGGANYMMEGAVTVSAMPTGTAGTPTATKGAVNNHAISVTPSVTNTTGYITGSTKTGTAVTVSASELVSGSETKTANGTYDVTNLASLVVNVSGGGGSNIVQGTFTTGATRNTTGAVALNYSGSGYPIACFVYINGGAYNNGTGGNTAWYDSVNRYDCGWFAMTKSRTTTAPTYGTGIDNTGTIALIYKNSTSNSTQYTRTSGMSINTYTSSSTYPTNSTGMMRFKGNGTTLAYYIGNLTSTTIGFPPSTEMAYIVIYSS